jgi:hypothetical protein
MRTLSRKTRLPHYLVIRTESSHRLGTSMMFGHVWVEFCAEGDNAPKWVNNSPFHDDGIDATTVGIVFASQIDSDAKDGQMSYAWRMGVGEGTTIHPVAYTQLARMMPHMKRFDAANERMRDKMGEPQSFGQWVAAHLSADKIAGVYYQYTDGTWGRFAGNLLAHLVDNAVRGVADTCSLTT